MVSAPDGPAPSAPVLSEPTPAMVSEPRMGSRRAVSGHAYPWDVIGDPAFAERVAGLGVPAVTLAASYHTTRAATPLHPRHQTVDAWHSALYRPVRDGLWGRLVPASPSWMDADDPFGEAAASLREAGLAVSAWVVLNHDTRLGRAVPDVTVVNCFGERYPYALCVQHAEVRDYAATLAAEALRGVAVDGVSLEACGQLGLVHAGRHEKTDGAWTPTAVRLLSICCCTACRAAWHTAGIDPAHTAASLRTAVQAEARGAAGAHLDAKVLDTILAVRHSATDALRQQVLESVRAVQPGVPVTLHASPDPWATGPSPGLTPEAAADVDALLVPCWPAGTASAEVVAAAAVHGRPVDAYVTVLPPADPADLDAHATRLAMAGASRLSLYHLGLAPRWRQRHLAELAARWPLSGSGPLSG